MTKLIIYSSGREPILFTISNTSDRLRALYKIREIGLENIIKITEQEPDVEPRIVTGSFFNLKDQIARLEKLPIKQQSLDDRIFETSARNRLLDKLNI